MEQTAINKIIDDGCISELRDLCEQEKGPHRELD